MLSRLKRRVISKLAPGVGLRLAYAGLVFCADLILARSLGLVEFGIYTYAVVWLSLLGLLVSLGLTRWVRKAFAPRPSALPAEATPAVSHRVRGLILAWASHNLILAAFALALVMILVAWVVNRWLQLGAFVGFATAVAFLPVLALTNLRRGVLEAAPQPVADKALAPWLPAWLTERRIEPLIAPLGVIVLTLIAVVWSPWPLTALWTIAFYGICLALALLLTTRMLTRTLPGLAAGEDWPKDWTAGKGFIDRWVQQFDEQGALSRSLWLPAGLPLLLLESLPLLNAQADVVMLGLIQGIDDAGLYVPVMRGAQLILLALGVLAAPMAASLARLYAEGRRIDLQLMVTRQARVVTGTAFLLATVLIVWGSGYLSLFGTAFGVGQRALMILAIGSFIAAAFGLALVVLEAAGQRAEIVKIGWSATGLNLLLNALLIPRWGIEGAAWATAVSLAGGGAMALVAARQKLGIDATLMGFPAKDSAT